MDLDRLLLFMQNVGCIEMFEKDLCGKLSDKLLSGDQFAISTHINRVQWMLSKMVSVMMIAT